MAAIAVTPPALQPLGTPSAKERRYDRQLRLWAASGQRALEEAHVLLLNGGTGVVGIETLKNLVLPGMGSFTIVDPADVKDGDLGVNFFLEEESLGKSRAEECARLLVELNPDVHGKGIKEDIKSFIDRTDLSLFTLVLVCGPIPSADLATIRQVTWSKSLPLFKVSCAGFYSSFSLQLPEKFPIVDTHPDPTSTQDLRLLAPWPELYSFAQSQTAGLESMSDHDHGHVPYLLLLLHYLDKWETENGGCIPKVYKDKTAFRNMVRAGARTANAEGGEENYDEAIAAVLKSLNEPSVPSGLKDILRHHECEDPQTSSADFWYIAHAIMLFVQQHGVLPLPGSIPDMKAQSKDYIELQNIYKSKARSDIAEVTKTVRELEDRLRGNSGNVSAIDAKEIEAFCKGAAHVRLLSGRSRDIHEQRHEYIAMQLEDEEGLFSIELAFQAINAILAEAPATAAADVPGMLALIDAEESASIMESYVESFLEGLQVEGGPEFDSSSAKIRVMLVLQELQRSGIAELHNIASLTGGMVAQEVIKVITKQYVPIDNTCVFDGITSKSATFRI